MKNKFMKVLGVIMSSVMVMGMMAGCGSSEEGNASTGKSDVKVAIVCDSAGQNDNGYNQSAVKGVKKAAEDFGVDYKVVEPTTGVPQALESLADDGYNLIFNLEYDFEALIKGTGGSKPIAEMYPETTFVVFNDNPNLGEDGNPIHKNVISVLFDVHESSFVAGALATLVNENHDKLFDSNEYRFTALDKGGRAMGFIGGTNSNGITVFSYGFIEGINHIAKELNVNYDYYAKYDAGFSDSATGSTVAGTFYNQGANVVFSVAGSVGDGAAAKAKEEGKLAIHVDANKDAQQPGYILTSVIKNTEVPVYNLIKSAVEGTIKEENNAQNFSLQSGATSITDLAEIEKHVKEDGKEDWNKIKEEIKSIEEKIGSGEIKITNAQEGQEFNPSSCPNVVIK